MIFSLTAFALSFTLFFVSKTAPTFEPARCPMLEVVLPRFSLEVKLVNPKLYGRGYAIGNMGHTDYVLVADDIVAVEEK